MEIILNIDLDEKLDNNDRKAINSNDRNLTKKEMIEENTLREFLPTKNAVEKLKEISKIINQDNELQLQVLNLDLRNKKKYPEFIDIWDLKNNENNIMYNIAFVFKLSKPFLNESNTFIFFTKIIKINQSADIEIHINRIEFLNIPFLEEKIDAVYNGHTSFEINFKKATIPSLDPELIDLLIKTKKINSSLSKSDSKEKFKFQDWNDLIFSLNNFYWKKDDKLLKDEVLVFDNEFIINDENEFFKNKIILCQESKNKYDVKSKKIYLDDSNDKSIPIRINKISDSKIKLEIENIVNDLEKRKQEKINDSEKITNKIHKFIDEKNKKEEELKIQENNIQKLTSPLYEKINELEKTNQLKVSFEIIKDERIECNKAEILKHNIKIDSIKVENEPIRSSIIFEIDEKKKEIEKYNIENKKIQKEIGELENELLKYKSIFNYINDDRFINIYDLEISSNYQEQTNKRIFKIRSILDYEKSELDKKKLGWVIINKDIGKMQVVRRYNTSFKNINMGFYKNPYLFYSLLSIPEINKSDLMNIEKWKDINDKIKSKYILNKEQIKVVEKSINMRDIFYLQGPPGTGKTQTICAIAEEYANNNNNILMTSSTHEAINNFFDRLNFKNLDNPNIILLKYRSNYPDENYGEDSILTSFLEKICNFSLKNNSNNIEKKYDEYIEKFGQNLPEFPTNYEIDFFKKIYIKNNDISILDIPRFKDFYKNFTKLYDMGPTIDDVDNIIDFMMKKNDYKSKKEQLELWNFIAESFDKIFVNLEEVQQEVKPKQTNYFIHMMKLFQKNLKSEKIKINKNEFLKFISENKLINIIGISTTSKTSFEILKNDIDLFSDYPIDLVIIDEISKSTTPEILGRVILSKKVIFAGDYKQLPPITEFSEVECEEFFESDQFEDLKSNKKLNDSEELFNFIGVLHTTSFFKCEIESVKKTSINIENRPYHNLKIQHRFSENIMNCVNEFYDYDEKLEMPLKSKVFNKYKCDFASDDFSLIDTSWIGKEFLNEIDKEGLTIPIYNNLYSSFDSNCSIFNNNQYPSKINDYNAKVIIEIIKNLIKNNGVDILIEKIGVICMTKSQKNIITYQMKKCLNDELINKLKIKIDTVDNFQGRERDIIIVDFVRAWNNLENNRKISDHPRNLSFYVILERINVALSRAESKLIIVGAFENHYLDKNTVSKGADKLDFFENIYKHASNLDSIFNWWELRGEK